MSNGWAEITSWLPPSHPQADYSCNTGTGVLTINTAGDYEVTAHILAIGGSNRTETGIRILKNVAVIVGCESRNYSSRNASQNEGSVCIPGILVNCNATDTLKVQGIYVGTASTAAARGTWFQVRKIGGATAQMGTFMVLRARRPPRLRLHSLASQGRLLLLTIILRQT